MKILYVCKSLPFSYQGGIQTHVWKLSEWMVRMGHEVSILRAGSLKKGEKHWYLDGRKIIEIPYLPGRKSPFLGTLLEELFFNISARKWLLQKQQDYDIIHLQGRSGNLFLWKKQQTSVPIASTVHGFIEIEQKFAIKKRWSTIADWLHQKMATWFETMALKNSDALIAVSRTMERAMRDRCKGAGHKTTKIHNGVDVPHALSFPNTFSDPNLLLFVGRLTALKGIFELVEAMRKVPRSIQLVMIGDGEDRPELEKKIKAYGLQHRIVLAGGLPSKKVFEWLNRCTALILPSYHETQGIVLLEANACGKPVIANAVGGIKEVIEHKKNGLLMSSNQPSEIAETIDYLFQHPQMATLMGLQGRLIVRELFSWKKITEDTIRLYGTLLAQKAKTSATAPIHSTPAVNLV